ncbi:MAG: exo-alpha-sialidase [Clostridia bacterium]|nr:exo-alpha-sialidase [Clostridia bacterium]
MIERRVMVIRCVPYKYRHIPIGGGGYVTGFFFSHGASPALYCRTDIGGMYRYDAGKERWVSLIDHVSHDDLRETCPISAALDESRPGRLYIAGGLRDPGSHGLLTISDDCGETFRRHELPFFVHGNLHGRGAGERLICRPPRDGGTHLWFATQADGLWHSTDEGVSWRHVDSFPETACTFVYHREGLLLVGTEGIACRCGDQRGPSLYASYDGGMSFEPVRQIEYTPVEGSRLHGLVAQRCACDGRYLYVSFSANGPRSQNVERGYTCDSGDCACGRIARYALESGRPAEPVDITPEKGPWGYSAVDVHAGAGLLITATISRRDGDAVYLSRDQGRTWRKILHRLDVGEMRFRLPYMRPCCNGGENLIHWLTDVKIDPHDADRAWFNTGTGVFRTGNLRAETVVWEDWCDGMEETVHIGVYAPPSGRVQVLDMIGDLGGFAFTDVDMHCDNSFADGEGNRWITCLNCDWQDSDPAHIIVTARGNWKGKTKGGLIVSHDGAQTWRRIGIPMGLSGELDELLRRISGVNINAGWAAMSADGSTYVWAVAEKIRLHARNVIVSHDGGCTFRRSCVLDADGRPAAGLMKPLADRLLPHVFYGFGEEGQMYVSTDGGDTFRQRPAPEGFPQVNFGLVDCADRTEIRVAPSMEPDGQSVSRLYIATGEGLWKLQYDYAADCFAGRRLTKAADAAFCVGLGVGRPGGSYAEEPKAIYFNGVLDGVYGFYRTLDEGASFERINDERQMYGRMHSIDGDKRIFGRFYLATGSSGLLYGEMEEQNDAY